MYLNKYNISISEVNEIKAFNLAADQHPDYFLAMVDLLLADKVVDNLVRHHPPLERAKIVSRVTNPSHLHPFLYL